MTETFRNPQPGGREVELFNDHIFRELRAYAQVPEDFVDEGWSLDNLQKGGGKGGTLMALVGSYVVKELSAGDHACLLQITGSYALHVRTGETLLCPVYLHFRDTLSGRCFFAMRNAVGAGPFSALYDLKGCADDKLIEKDGAPIKAVHKRIWNIDMWLAKSAWSEERRIYYEGKVEARKVDIPLPADQRAQCLKAIEQDTKWLADQKLMDYSLLVAVRDAPAGGSASGGSGPSALGHRPYVFKHAGTGREVSVSITIIDFLQKWTTGKKAAGCLKFAERNKATVAPKAYAERFLKHFRTHIVECSSLGSVPGPAPGRGGGAVAPPAGDFEAEGQPEERLNSRPMPEEEGPREAASL